MQRIIDLPLLERPREKANRYGINSLSDDELVALLIGYGGKDNSAIDIAKTMLLDSGGLYNLVNKNIEQLKLYKGIKDAKALSLAAIFEIAKRYKMKEVDRKEEKVDRDYLLNKYENRLKNSEQEIFVLIILDKKKRITHELELYRGSHRRISISFHDIFKNVMLHDGFFIYVIHNHPNSGFKPSKEDVIFTQELLNRCEKMEIVLLDHLIIAKDGYYSFQKENDLKI